MSPHYVAMRPVAHHLRYSGERSSKQQVVMADRRAGKGPYVPDEGGGKQPRSRNQDGTCRAPSAVMPASRAEAAAVGRKEEVAARFGSDPGSKIARDN